MNHEAELREQTVQSTMLLAIYGRAKASRLFPDIMRDGEAIRIVDGMDYDFADIARSMFDYAWLDEVKADADGGVFILAGGLFYYFREEQVRELVARVAEHFPRGELFFDAQSKTAIKVSNRMVHKTGNKGSQMYFYVNDPQKLKSWSPRIRKVESVAFFGDLLKEKRFKFSTKAMMWGLEKLNMGSLISVAWGT
jgi:O-methyltransferase involved in polyketide biosynthesis